MQRSFSRISKLTLTLFSLAFLSLAANGQTTAQDRILLPVEGGRLSTLPGTIHPLARSEYDQGPVTGGMQLRGMSINFAPSVTQQAALTALLKAQQDPSSPSYHQWLTTDQYGTRFGMTQADIGKVSAWLRSQGFRVDKVAESSNAIWFSGTAATAEAAFHTQIHSYLVDGKTHFANATEVSLPSAFAATVINVGGLNDFRLKPQFIHMHASSATGISPNFTSGLSGSHYLTPGDLAVIYDLNPLYTAGVTGAGQTIGIIGQTDIVQADITNFRSAAGLPAYGSPGGPTFTDYLIPISSDPGIGYGGDLVEADLDLEYSGGVATNANIVFVNSTSVISSLEYAIENKINGVQIPILSMSYGGCEAAQGISYKALEVILEEANTQGQTVMTSSGDSGAAACDVSETVVITSAANGPAVNYPSSSAFVTGVGGSEFMGDGTAASPETGAGTYWNYTSGTDIVTSAKSYIPEMGWNDTAFAISVGEGLSATGGGASILFAKPDWQAGVAGIPADSVRDVPDISLTASPAHDAYLMCTQIVLDSSPAGSYSSSCGNGFRISDVGGNDNNNLFTVGGTSASTPSFAGIMALIEQKLGTSQGLGNINPTLYGLAANATTYATAFHDVTTGNNAVPCTAGTTGCPAAGSFGFSAGVGYDQVTGLGSVDGNALATAFASAQITPGTTTTVTFSPTSPVVDGAVTLTATVVASSGTAAPTGSVVFTVDGTALAPVDLSAFTTASTSTASTSTTFSTGGIHTVTAAYMPGTGDNFFSSTGSTSITVAATGVIPTTTTVVLNPATTVAVGSSLAITATVTANPATGTLPGTVNFFAGTNTTPLNATPVAVTPTTPGTGTASYTVSAVQTSLGFVVGTSTITAHYTGNSSYAASSGTAAITVTNPGLTVAVGNITISSPNPGSSGMSTITVTSTGGYSGTVNLAATSTTLDAQGTITPAQLAIASGASGTATITITTVSANVTKGPIGNLKKSQTSDHRVILGAAAAFGAIFLLAIPGFRRRRWPVLTALLLLGALSAGMGCGGSGNGGGSNMPASPAGTYNVTLTATDSASSAITASTNFTVVIQ